MDTQRKSLDSIPGYVHPRTCNRKNNDNPYKLFTSKESKKKVKYICPYCKEPAQVISNSAGEKDCWCKNQHRWFQLGDKVRVLRVKD